MKRNILLITIGLLLLAAGCTSDTGVIKKATPPKEQSQSEIQSGGSLGTPVKDNE